MLQWSQVLPELLFRFDYLQLTIIGRDSVRVYQHILTSRLTTPQALIP